MPEVSHPPGPEETVVGSYFVANYPPFSVWTRTAVDDAKAALQAPPRDVPLGLYVHIPFCRKRCHFCYFRVYTDKNARQVEDYLDLADGGVGTGIWRRRRSPAGRCTSSISGAGRRRSCRRSSCGGWSPASRPGQTGARPRKSPSSASPGRSAMPSSALLREIGVTRLSLGVENFDDRILELNGRAHRSPEIYRVFEQARRLDFPQINIDLIAGMIGESDANWRAAIDRTIELSPDSVTIYQMELPFNTTISGNLLKGAGDLGGSIAGWAQKRRWVTEAFEALEAAGYHVGSAYTAVKDPAKATFVYRDSLWEGADLVGLGVASFGHVNGVHLQNLDTWEQYSAAIEAGELPLGRAYRPSGDERLIREFILQLKRGRVRPGYFHDKYGVDPLRRFHAELASLQSEGFLTELSPERVALTRDGLLRVDSLLHRFFLPQHAGIRYT